MPVLKIFAFMLAVTVAAPALASECKELRDFERSEAKPGQKYVDVFTFRKNRRGDSVLLLFKDTIERGKTPGHWAFLHRPSPDMTSLCVVGRGEAFGHYDDDPQSRYAGEFGEEGSGHPRCATSDDEIVAKDAMRAFANRTLGNDIVLYGEGLSGPGFQFAIGPDHDWIIIQDNEDKPQTSCLFDSGTDVLMRFNIQVPVD